jgi:hypothetical protein
VEVEGCCQIQGRFVQRQATDCGPQIQDIAAHRATRFETLESLFAQVDRKGFLTLAGLAVHGTTAAPLQAATAELLEQARSRKRGQGTLANSRVEEWRGGLDVALRVAGPFLCRSRISVVAAIRLETTIRRQWRFGLQTATGENYCEQLSKKPSRC